MNEYLPLIAALGIGIPSGVHLKLSWFGQSLWCGGLCALFTIIWMSK